MSPRFQSVYADVFSMLGYVTDEEMKRLRELDAQTLSMQEDGDFVEAIYPSQKALHTFAGEVSKADIARSCILTCA